jgi:type II secretory pathway pseudopilin PulG
MIKMKNLKNNQSGIASMVIVMLIMTLLTLIVVSMTKNANREQRQALDRQLNSQAFYAAESGVNDTIKYVLANSSAANRKSNCDGVTGAGSGDQFPGSSSTINSQGPISYSCVIYDKEPESLVFDPIATDKSEVFVIDNANAGGVESLTFSWEQQNGGTNFSGCRADNAFPDLSSYSTSCEAGVLRVDLIEPDTNRSNLINNTFTAFFSPRSSGGSGTINYSSGRGESGQGAIIGSTCNSSSKCQVTVNGIGGRDRLYLHIRSVYKPNKLTITGANASGQAVKFQNAQMMVDSTGKANDILKRIQVRVPLYKEGLYPEFALQTANDICKLINTNGNTTSDGCN